MKRLALASVLISLGAFGACAVEEPVSGDNVAGTGPVSGASGTGAQGGTVGGGQGGSISGTGGATGATGGTITGGVGGAISGGASGVGGDGLGGLPPGGQGGTGGDMGGVGNIGGMTGGTGGMTGGTGGMTGGTGGTAGAECPAPATLFPMAPPTGQTSGLTGNVHPPNAPAGSLEGHLIYTPCANTSCDDCGGAGWRYKGISRACNADGNGLNAIQNFTVGGTPGTPYNVTLHFYGIVEPKNYGSAVTRQYGNTRPQQSDTGTMTNPPWAYANGNPNYQQSDYNTYEIHVVDNNGMEVCSYFLNSDTGEGHWTYVLNYERTITVIGGGRVRVRVYDRNCRMIKNCMSGGTQGPCSASGCNNKARTLTAVNNAMPPPGSELMQPGLGVADNQAGQWLYIDVTNVACTGQRIACTMANQ